MKKAKKKIFKPHYRKSKKTHHPAYVYEDDGEDFHFVGITHGSQTHRKENIPLPSNPDPEDRSASYAVNWTDKDRRNRFGKKENWKVTKGNRKVFDEIIGKKKMK